MTFIAWDIETCPIPIERMTEAQRARFQKELKRQLARTPDMSEDTAGKLVRSVHPMLGWICCISAVRGTEEDHGQPRTWTADTIEDESSMLMQFWNDVKPFKGITWVTFNGKRFDVPFLLARSVHYRLTPTRNDLLQTYPYRHHPHLDLMTVWPQSYSLNDLCDHLCVPSPKSDMDGSHVADAVSMGRIDDVATYCAADVTATLACVQAMPILSTL